jgi:ATP-dependent Lhr-like helicase
MGPPLQEDAIALAVARQWLNRYGIVTRELWKRERPPVSWRSVYLELKKLEFRGEARRGYFVRGLGGAQFAAPAAVELLRATAAQDPADAPVVVLAASDPANVYSLGIAPELRDPLSRPRGGGALLVTRAGRVAISVEGRGRRIVIADWMTREDVERAKEILSQHLRGEKGARYLMLPDIRSS